MQFEIVDRDKRLRFRQNEETEQSKWTKITFSTHRAKEKEKRRKKSDTIKKNHAHNFGENDKVGETDIAFILNKLCKYSWTLSRHRNRNSGNYIA